MQWDNGEWATHSTKGYDEQAKAFMASGKPQESLNSKGDTAAAFASAAKVVDAQYHYPFLAHVPMERVHTVAGLVEETLPAQAPEQVALLRLDTDYYTSTKHELEALWPRVPSGGFLLVDDYGHFAGARQAVDEFFADAPPFLHRVDYTCRLVVKP